MQHTSHLYRQLFIKIHFLNRSVVFGTPVYIFLLPIKSTEKHFCVKIVIMYSIIMFLKFIKIPRLLQRTTHFYRYPFQKNSFSKQFRYFGAPPIYFSMPTKNTRAFLCENMNNIFINMFFEIYQNQYICNSGINIVLSLLYYNYYNYFIEILYVKSRIVKLSSKNV